MFSSLILLSPKLAVCSVLHVSKQQRIKMVIFSEDNFVIFSFYKAVLNNQKKRTRGTSKYNIFKNFLLYFFRISRGRDVVEISPTCSVFLLFDNS